MTTNGTGVIPTGVRPTVRRGLLTAIAGFVLLGCADAAPDGLVRANDNRSPAGTLRRDTLSIRLVVQMPAWRPESDTGRAISVAAVAEEGKAPQIPAPLIRVREGTVIAATVRNALTDSTIKVIGLATRPAVVHDTIALKPGESREVHFVAGAPGTYLYAAILGAYKDGEREQAAGAFVVDPREGSPPDRILVINIWGDPLDSTKYSNALAINGRSWPSTERIDAVVGDSLRWRVVNASIRPHPMHLHGAYFRVDSKSDPHADTGYAPTAQRLAVTEEMLPRQSMSIVWSPVRQGRWLFHCHIAFHVIPTEARIDPAPHGGHDEQSTDPLEHMAGLVIGINARLPRGARDPDRVNARKMDLFVQEGAKRGRNPRALGFVLQMGDEPPAVDSVPRAGTFMYHTHVRDVAQLSAGLYGPIIVLEPGQRFDPTKDHVHTVGWDGEGDKVHLLVNGDSVQSPPIRMTLGETHRLRFINIGAAAPAFFSIWNGKALASWRAVAKDGAELQSAQRVVRPAQILMDVGQTYDFEFTPDRRGEYVLDTPVDPNGAKWTRKVVVR